MTTDPRTLLAEARTLITGRIGPLNAWLGRNLRALIDGYAAALDELEHATAHDGDHLSKASRHMVETVLNDRDALRVKVQQLTETIARLRDLATLAGNAAITAADELRQLRACAVCGACETHDVPAEIAKLTSERDLGNRLLSHAVEYQHRLEADVDRLRAEVELRRANPLHCAVSRAGETTFECDAAKPCAPCMARMEIERLLTQCDEDMYCMSQEAIELACSRNK